VKPVFNAIEPPRRQQRSRLLCFDLPTGMDVWEKLISLINRWKRNPFHFLGLLHRAKICVQVQQKTAPPWLCLLLFFFLSPLLI